MPKFNLSPDDASRLVNYFAAMDNAQYPYEFDPRRQADHLASKESEYARTVSESGAPEANLDRLDAALDYITKTECVKCHSVGDFEPKGGVRALAPEPGECLPAAPARLHP